MLIPSNMLRMGEKVFIDDLTADQVEERLGLHVAPIVSGGADFIQAVIDPSYSMDRNNETLGYIQAFDDDEN